MATPLFDGSAIFNSINGSGGSFFQGVLYEPEYSKIRQTIHFNGVDGDTYLTHGYPDRPWKYTGYISHADTDINSLYSILSTIQDFIDEADQSDDTYHELVDSFGNSFDKAQVHHMAILDLRVRVPGWIAQVEITGIIKGMQHDGPDGSGSSG